jgi:serine/threonine protein kinase
MTECLHDEADAFRSRKWTICSKLSILFDVVQGLEHLHDYGLVHGRLKSTNVMIFDDYRAKICDFGYQSFLTLENRRKRRGRDGIRWTPPEVVQLEHHMNLEAQKEEKTVTVSNILGMILTDKNHGLIIIDLSGLGYPPILTSPTVDVYAFGLMLGESSSATSHLLR